MAASSQEVVENTIAVLAVADVQASLRFYLDVLNFKHDWGGDVDSPHIASVSRNGHAIMIQQRSPLVAGCVWIGVSAMAALWEAVRADPRVVIVQPPTKQPWALEMKIADPDGNILWFGADPQSATELG